jgi:sucrose-6-phosphate hydrolase SacC (GH32 family)
VKAKFEIRTISLRDGSAVVRLALTVGTVWLLSALTSVSAKEGDTPTGDWKPKIHFDAGPVWNNDPNGPILLNGKYNLFYPTSGET